MSVARIWRENRSRYNLIGNTCTVCGQTFFPMRTVCPKCHRESIGKMEEKPLSGMGSIYSFSVVHSAPESFQTVKPYVMGIIEMDEGVKLTAQIVDADLEAIAIGDRVKAVFRRVREIDSEGVIQYGYKFIRLNGEETG